MQVTTVDTLNLYGKDRKVISFERLRGNCHYNFQFIEGIGSNYGFDYFYSPFYYTSSPGPMEVLCVFKDGKQVYGDSICYIRRITSNVQDQNEMDKISIYPNPTSSQISINNSGNLSGELKWQLFNSTDKKIKSEVINQGIQTIDLESFAPGLYIYQIIKKGKVIQSDKLVILRE